MNALSVSAYQVKPNKRFMEVCKKVKSIVKIFIVTRGGTTHLLKYIYFRNLLKTLYFLRVSLSDDTFYFY